MIDAELIAKMKNLIEAGKKKGNVVNANEAFEKYPPEGTWVKDKDGNIIIKECGYDL